MFNLAHEVMHGNLKFISGKEYDKHIERAEEFEKTMRKITNRDPEGSDTISTRFGLGVAVENGSTITKGGASLSPSTPVIPSGKNFSPPVVKQKHARPFMLRPLAC